ncbi:unnamed protein product [Brachionus calyciflorus]|uniref:Uncharacterized protein n=1 Tax=Brachionus calyciflorus TaxID=104777 RepID=A0A814KYV2_9BILA|nr:unnamed protein product [Brachionus calyciflorus]
MIDLLLHNGDLVSETDVIECPFSDNHFVVAKLDIQKSPNILKQIECRNLSSVNILKINSLIEEIDFQQIRNYDDINEKWLYVKNKITEIIDYVAPLRKITVKNMNQFPWYDDYLIFLKHQKNAAYKRYTRTLSLNDKETYNSMNSLFNSYNEEKLIEYFKEKSMNDLKIQRNFPNTILRK